MSDFRDSSKMCQSAQTQNNFISLFFPSGEGWTCPLLRGLLPAWALHFPISGSHTNAQTERVICRLQHTHLHLITSLKAKDTILLRS